MIEIIHVTPESGGQKLALLEGMTPDEVTSALLAVNNDASDMKEFWTVTPGNWTRHSARLLWACNELERIELNAKATALGYADYQAWSAALDAMAQAKTKRTAPTRVSKPGTSTSTGAKRQGRPCRSRTPMRSAITSGTSRR